MGTTNQFDNYQIDPNTLGDDWAFSDDELHMNRPPHTKLSNPQYYFVGARYAADRTRTVFDFASKGNLENPTITRNIHDGWLGHGVDWAEFNYNPYGRQDVWNNTWSQNTNFRIKNDWLQMLGLGDLNLPTHDVMDQNEVNPASMVQYVNYPTEGWNSFGKKSAGATGDKRWTWQGNTWVPGT